MTSRRRLPDAKTVERERLMHAALLEAQREALSGRERLPDDYDFFPHATKALEARKMTSRREAMLNALEAVGIAALAGKDEAEFFPTFERILREHGYWVAPWEPTAAMIKAAEAGDDQGSSIFGDPFVALPHDDAYRAMRDASEAEG